jgi:hypothetical protein
MGAAASLNPTVLSVEPGAEATAQIKIRNTGNVVDQFSIDVVGEPTAWSTVEPSTLSLLPGTEGTATVTFRPPRTSDVAAGSFPFGVRVASKEDPQGSVTEEGTLEVGGFKEVFGELLPRTSRGRSEGRHELAVDNRGNVRLNADLEATDPNGSLRFRFSPAGLVTDPNTATFAKVSVRPLKRFLKGPPKTHPFQVVVKPQATPPVTVDGVMLQEAILPPWLMKAVVALLALLALAALLWAVLLKPAIKSAAKDVIKAPLAAQDAKVANLAGGQKALNDAITPIIGHPVPTPSISIVPSPTGVIGATAAGDPFHQRLPNPGKVFSPNATGTDAYPVGAKDTLSISDIVLENPQGDSGTVSIQVVDGATTGTLLTENMDNFRALDYHFVSPPVLTGNQKLQIQVNCPGNNGAQATPPVPPRACVPSVFFSGFLNKGS